MKVVYIYVFYHCIYIYLRVPVAIFQQQPALQICVQSAIEQALQDISAPIVERSVKIACISTQKIVTKDFALEADEQKLRKAALMMAQQLASSLV